MEKKILSYKNAQTYYQKIRNSYRLCNIITTQMAKLHKKKRFSDGTKKENKTSQAWPHLCGLEWRLNQKGNENHLKQHC